MSLEVIDWNAFLRGSTNGSADGAVTGKTCSAPAAMTVGVFDGVHLGHQALLETIVRRGPNPTVVTFRENPKKVTAPDRYDGDIFSLRQKLRLFERFRVSRVILIDFSEDFSRMSGREFFDLLEDRGKMAFLAIGNNFRCGFRQETDAELITEMNRRKGIPTEVLPPVTAGAENIPVSSSRIRAAITEGAFKLASSLCGRNIELDISDMAPVASVRENRTGFLYDFRSAARVAPKAGQYRVMIKPDNVICEANAEDGRIFLSVKRGRPAETIEFIEEYKYGIEQG